MEPTTSAAVTFTLAVSALKKPLGHAYDAASGEVRRRLKRIQADDKIRQIHRAISSVQKVKTLWKLDKEVKLMTFYYPSRVIREKKPTDISSISEIDASSSFVIQGTVGQGKSIFLRYLCLRELSLGARVPLFVELRRFNPSHDFREFLIATLGIYSLPADQDTFLYLLESGRLVLLLDGFDEVDVDAVTKVVAELELLIQQYRELRVVVTSRPDSGIQNSPHFRVYELAPLSHKEHESFLDTTVSDKTLRKQILAAIKSSSGEIKGLLKTPLLLTMLVMVYSATQQIPPVLSRFYEDLFSILGSRHDGTKVGFKRRRASGLDDYELRKFFEAFCFASRRKGLLVITQAQFDELAAASAVVTGTRCSTGALADDVTKVTCLLLREGMAYQFIHKSVAEYHAASFIHRSSEPNAMKFYADVLGPTWSKWRQELVFLSQIDRTRYLKYFEIPALSKLLSKFGTTKGAGGTYVVAVPSDDFILGRFGTVALFFMEQKERGSVTSKSAMGRGARHSSSASGFSHEFGEEILEMAFVHNLLSIFHDYQFSAPANIGRLESFEVTLQQLMGDPIHANKIRGALRSGVNTLVKRIVEGENELLRDDSVSAFIA